MIKDLNDIIGRRNGKLTIVAYAGSWKDSYINKKRNAEEKKLRHIYLAQCDCGGTKLVRRDAFLEGMNKSCGCLSKIGENMDNIIQERIAAGKRL